MFEVVRYEPKDFRPRRPDGRGGHLWHLDGLTPRLYRLNALAGRERAVIAEGVGEQDVDRLWSLELPAMCNAGGAGQWRPEHTGQLKAAGVRRVVVAADADEAGRAQGQAVARACAAAGLGVRIAVLADGAKDVSAFVSGGRGRNDLLAVFKAAEPYERSVDSLALPAGVVRLSDADAEDTSPQGPPVVARLLAHAGRVTLLQAREKAGKSTLVGAAVTAVTRGRPFLGMPTLAGDVLWVGGRGDGGRRLYEA